MAIDFDADLLAMLNLNHFAVSATYGITEVQGIFDQDYYAIVDGEGVAESSQPAFSCRTADLPDIVHGETLTINSLVYTIVGVKPDGTGMTAIALEAP